GRNLHVSSRRFRTLDEPSGQRVFEKTAAEPLLLGSRCRPEPRIEPVDLLLHRPARIRFAGVCRGHRLVIWRRDREKPNRKRLNLRWLMRMAEGGAVGTRAQQREVIQRVIELDRLVERSTRMLEEIPRRVEEIPQVLFGGL